MFTVVHINYSDSEGGASRAMWTLHIGLKNLGIDSKIYCFQTAGKHPEVIRFNPPKALINKTRIYFRKIKLIKELRKYQIPVGHEPFSDDRSVFGKNILEQLPDADIYHLHWVAGFLDLPSFFKTIKTPAVWTLHDMNPFTGGCHYSSGCTNFISNCGECPQLNSSSPDDLSFQIFNRKLNFNKKKNLYVVPNSSWLNELAIKSKVFKSVQSETINLGIDTELFKPREKENLRRAFNLPPDKKIILFGAMDNSNRRKGFIELIRALEILKDQQPDIHLVTFGNGETINIPVFQHLDLGHIDNDFILSLVYNLADVFVISSLEESFGLTALESISCGIPVAGFNSGGIPDIVENEITGFLAETGNIAGLADSIYQILKLDKKSYLKMANNCREKALAWFTMNNQAGKYIKIYSELLK